jgi:hypothetical protein
MLLGLSSWLLAPVVSTLAADIAVTAVAAAVPSAVPALFAAGTSADRPRQVTARPAELAEAR